MKFTIAKKELLHVANRLRGIVPTRSPLPILSNLLLRQEGPCLWLSATDLVMGATECVPVEVNSPGTPFAVPAKEFVDRVTAMPDGPIHLLREENKCSLRAPGHKRSFSLSVVPGEDFPEIPTLTDQAVTVTIEAQTFASILRETSYAILDDTTRAHLNSLLIECEDGIVRAIATDGHRLAKSERCGKHGVLRLLVPKIAVGMLEKMASADVRVATSDAHAFFMSGQMTFSVKLIDAVFPPWQQVVPNNSPYQFTADRARLLEAVKAISIVADDKTGGVDFTFSDTGIVVSAGTEHGSGSDEVAAVPVGNNLQKEVTLRMCAKYALDSLNSMSSETVSLEFSRELDPIVLRPSPDAFAVIMPQRQ